MSDPGADKRRIRQEVACEIDRLREAIRGYLPSRLDRVALIADLDPALPMIAAHNLMFRAGENWSPRLSVWCMDSVKVDKDAAYVLRDVAKKAAALRDALFKPGRFPYVALVYGLGAGEVRFDDAQGFDPKTLHEALRMLIERSEKIAAAAVGPNPGKPEVRAITASVQIALQRHGLSERVFFRPVMRAILGKARVGERATARRSNATKPARRI